MTAPFLTVNDISVIANDSKGFVLAVNGYDVIECEYRPTTGYEGFGKSKRKVIYPNGSIAIKGSSRCYPSLYQLKLALVCKLNMQSKY